MSIFGGAYDEDAADIDVHALHQGYLRLLRRHGTIEARTQSLGGLDRASFAPGRCSNLG